jgi:uncharacterized protein DUF1707
MAGLEHEMAAGGGRGRLRASHADRERVIGTLKAAYAYGLVTKDEFDARVSQTFAARTYAELAVITADIPAGLAPAPPPLRDCCVTRPLSHLLGVVACRRVKWIIPAKIALCEQPQTRRG